MSIEKVKKQLNDTLDCEIRWEKTFGSFRRF